MFRNLFNKKNKELTKDEIAEFLKTSPEALAKFEDAMLHHIVANAVMVEAGSSDFYKSE